MTTRLERLFVLLENGSSSLTRKAAAQQLGDVLKLHPHELYSLLDRVHEYLQSSSWECRIAAGQAVEAIVSNLPQWRPTPASQLTDEVCVPSSSPSPPYLQLTLESFNLDQVLAENPILTSLETADATDDQGIQDDVTGPADVSTQRRLVNQRLGLDVAESLGVDTSGIFSDADLMCSTASQSADSGPAHQSEEQTSSRKVNQHRRRLREGADRQRPPGAVEPPLKLARTEQSGPVRRQLSTYLTGERWDQGPEWPLESWCQLLCDDLTSPQWEVRHGAVTALRETLKSQGTGAGRRHGLTEQQMTERHRLRLEDLALRLVRLLALDRFGDYVADQVVAPVRETAAQALAAALHLLPVGSVLEVAAVLLLLLRRPEWEVRHGGHLALRYLLAVRGHQLPPERLRTLLQAAIRGLGDVCDDVSAVAACCLVASTEWLVRLLPASAVAALVHTLWHSLTELDELMTSTPSVLQLLATLSCRAELAADRTWLPDVVPRLWPFLGHPSSNVRRSAVKTLSQLVGTQDLDAWSPQLIEAALRFTFQRAVVESHDDIVDLLVKTWTCLLCRSPLATLLTAACPHVASWLCILMQPTRVAINSALLLTPPAPSGRAAGAATSSAPSGELCQLQYLGGPAAAAAGGQQRERAATRARLTGAALLGVLSRYIVQPMPGASYEDMSPLTSYVSLLSAHLGSVSALQRSVVGHVLAEWAQACPEPPLPDSLVHRLHVCLSEPVCYDEMAVSFSRLQQDCRDYLALLRHYNLPVDDSLQTARVLSFEQIRQLSGPVSAELLAGVQDSLSAQVTETLQLRQQSVRTASHLVGDEQTCWATRTQMALARPLVLMNRLTDKLNPVVRPLMESIKRETDPRLQDLAAESIVRLLELHRERQSTPILKIIKNLCVLICYEVCPASTSCVQECRSDGQLGRHGSQRGIITLERLQQTAEERATRRGPTSHDTGGPLAEAAATPTSAEHTLTGQNPQVQRELQRRGAVRALTALCERFAATPPDRLLELSLVQLDAALPTEERAVERLVSALQVTEVIVPSLHAAVAQQALRRLGRLREFLGSQFKSVRHMAARCMAAYARLDLHATLTSVVRHVLPLLGDTFSVVARQGAIETVWCLVDALWMDVLPYLVLLVVPVLGRMSDRDLPVRLLASRTFASIIQLMPLEPGCPGGDAVPSPLNQQKVAERCFLDQLMDPSCIEDVPVPAGVRAQLRPYQRRGVSWLAFLNKYHLHGVLCDDMGLGKSLQSLCMIVADHAARREQFERSGATEDAPRPSLIVCPPTLTGHWMYEVDKFVEPSELRPLHYFGLPAERSRLQVRLPNHNLVISSYDIVRNDIDFFVNVKWNYCVLDEGHIIKNGKTKVAKAIKQLDSRRRLILTGTPLQNSVLELWSLFDFLMPGFLGTERQFTTRYSRPILLSRDAKANSREQEAGALAMEALHRQVLPFLLRRLKEDVLEDLPPKITQDYYCELSDIQKQLYEDFARSRAQRSLVEGLESVENRRGVERAPPHVFQALQYLRKVCNHPKLVLTKQHPSYAQVQKTLCEQGSSLEQIDHSAKLVALKQLLLDLGIGEEDGMPTASSEVVHPHRVLIFCQLRSMLDMVEHDLLQGHLSGVTYLRLDGSVPAGERHALVHRFNSDPSIDCLLLTTQVGGLGLNLVGADTVIFVEHDWNPMKDLQAMDRAHRIGQRRVVNVYRLITRGTLEEKIMGLQKFKLLTANTVITAENSSLLTMGTDQLFDLFTLESQQQRPGAGGEARGGPEARGIRAMLEALPELWEGEQYEQEYDLSGFMRTLRG